MSKATLFATVALCLSCFALWVQIERHLSRPAEPEWKHHRIAVPVGEHAYIASRTTADGSFVARKLFVLPGTDKVIVEFDSPTPGLDRLDIGEMLSLGKD